MPTTRSKGNLQSMLNAYEEKNGNGPTVANTETTTVADNSIDGTGPSDISIQLDAMGRERSSTLGSFRERGLTFDSVAEFDLGLGFGDGGVPEGIEFAPPNVNDTDAAKAANMTITSNPGAPGTISGKLATQEMNEEAEVGVINKHRANSFFSEVFGNNSNISVNIIDRASSALLGHTPPSTVATSYEGKHFGKRMRSGSISGRLRSMSDLEDRGIIDQQQKGVLKDLIIAGDDDLQIALDKFESGDRSALESIVSKLKTRKSSDIDLLGDLDLDFLSMGNTDFGVERGNNSNNNIAQPAKTMEGSNHSGTSTPHIRDPSPGPTQNSTGYDGIGELDFNGDYAGATEQNIAQIAQTPSQAQQSHPQPTVVSSGTKFRSDSLVDFTRNRANSLAFGVLLEEPSNSDVEDSMAKWMDRTPAPIPEQRQPLKKRANSHIVGANGGLYIINDSNDDIQQQTPVDTSNMTKAEIRAMKKREKEELKARKEAEKLAKKEKKERDAKMKKYKKNKKGETVKKKNEDPNSDDEPKIIVSGTGRPRSLSDPNLSIGLDANGLMHIENPPDWVGAYSPESRKIRIERFLAKRNHRVWVKKVKYDVRKNFADSRLRVKGRFVKKEDELLMRDLMSLT